MSTSTRMLVLGAVQIFEPVNGYQIRRELLSWGVDEWAHIKPGSIYTVLGTLARQGLCERHSVEEGSRTVAVYTMTDLGRAEFMQLVEQAVTVVDITHPLPLHAAMAMVPLVERTAMRDWLGVRIAKLEELVNQPLYVEPGRELDRIAPPHVVELVALGQAEGQAQLQWCQSLVRQIDDGKLSFVGEEHFWEPPPSDPGWEMVAEAARYREMLGLV